MMNSTDYISISAGRYKLRSIYDLSTKGFCVIQAHTIGTNITIGQQVMCVCA